MPNKNQHQAPECKHWCNVVDNHQRCPGCRSKGKGSDRCVAGQHCDVCASWSQETVDLIWKKRRPYEGRKSLKDSAKRPDRLQSSKDWPVSGSSDSESSSTNSRSTYSSGSTRSRSSPSRKRRHHSSSSKYRSRSPGIKKRSEFTDIPTDNSTGFILKTGHGLPETGNIGQEVQKTVTPVNETVKNKVNNSELYGLDNITIDNPLQNMALDIDKYIHNDGGHTPVQDENIVNSELNLSNIPLPEDREKVKKNIYPLLGEYSNPIQNKTPSFMSKEQFAHMFTEYLQDSGNILESLQKTDAAFVSQSKHQIAASEENVAMHKESPERARSRVSYSPSPERGRRKKRARYHYTSSDSRSNSRSRHRRAKRKHKKSHRHRRSHSSRKRSRHIFTISSDNDLSDENPMELSVKSTSLDNRSVISHPLDIPKLPDSFSNLVYARQKHSLDHISALPDVETNTGGQYREHPQSPSCRMVRDPSPDPALMSTRDTTNAEKQPQSAKAITDDLICNTLNLVRPDKPVPTKFTMSEFRTPVKKSDYALPLSRGVISAIDDFNSKLADVKSIDRQLHAKVESREFPRLPPVVKSYLCLDNQLQHDASLIPENFVNIKTKGRDDRVFVKPKTMQQLESLSREALLVSSHMDFTLFAAQKTFKDNTEQWLKSSDPEGINPEEPVRRVSLLLKSIAEDMHYMNARLATMVGYTTLLRRDALLAHAYRSVKHDTFNQLRKSPVGKDLILPTDLVAQAHKEVEQAIAPGSAYAGRRNLPSRQVVESQAANIRESPAPVYNNTQRSQPMSSGQQSYKEGQKSKQHFQKKQGYDKSKFNRRNKFYNKKYNR